MTKKDKNLTRLRELAALLGREPDESGSAADIAQRVAEMEEELGNTDDNISQDTTPGPDVMMAGNQNKSASARSDTDGLVTLVALATLHIDAIHPTRDEHLAFVLPGAAFRVSVGVAASITERGLATMQ